MALQPLTERDLDTLNELAPLWRDDPIKWHTTQEVGGTNGSHHSGTLAKLAKRGLVDFCQRGHVNLPEYLNKTFRGRKGSKVYRLSEAGYAFLLEHRETWRNRVEGEAFMAERTAEVKARKAAKAAASQ
ncbi:hypothetical protein CcrC1_gp268c [Caulobacter phage C1]|nr:hypothetical protein CcrC1_gp268c [Caulobacter phage C1]UTU08497.1 hypothetical protein CcrC2_gp269c [Caulobacter phage C2]UTU09012.1 hypothetical protein CcrJ4_gp263c [Caulobacter phage J4]UTU10130.1 hypothetical protein CcrRB23_gp268c [Caulobacter phage RB23]WGN97164.1 hypothetical protein [Bertelyvirus sp.]